MPRKFGPAKLEMFKQIFSDRIKELLAKVKASSSLELDVDGDEVDIIQGNVIQDISDRLSKRDMDKLSKLYSALDKIADGTFGKCTECDVSIGEKRLLAIPGCDLCISCAEEEEKQAKQFINK